MRNEQQKREEIISIENPEFALLVLGVERLNRATYLWKGKNKTYKVSEMSDEQLENIITMLHKVIEKSIGGTDEGQ